MTRTMRLALQWPRSLARKLSTARHSRSPHTLRAYIDPQPELIR